MFEHEYSILNSGSLTAYLTESHELVAGTVAEHTIINRDLKGIRREIYDAALLDCNEYQAKLMALGVDVSEDNYEIPPIGWYRIRPEYGNQFCYEKELTE